MIRKAKAEWRGTGKDGTGDITSDSGVLSKTPYSFKTRFQGEKGTNPEELIAAAHAGCFTMALAFQLQTAGFTPTSLETEAAVSLDQDGGGLQDQQVGADPGGRGAESRPGDLRQAGRGGRKRLSRVQVAQRGDYAEQDLEIGSGIKPGAPHLAAPPQSRGRFQWFASLPVRWRC